MDGFLGTTIQFAEQEIKRLEEEHANKMVYIFKIFFCVWFQLFKIKQFSNKQYLD